MRYRIDIKAEAKQDIRRLPGAIRAQVWKIIDALADEPRPPGAHEVKVK